MGSGKTTVGRQLSKRLRMDFVDSDHMIEERCGVSIATNLISKVKTAFVFEKLRCYVNYVSEQAQF